MGAAFSITFLALLLLMVSSIAGFIGDRRRAVALGMMGMVFIAFTMIGIGLTPPK